MTRRRMHVATGLVIAGVALVVAAAALARPSAKAPRAIFCAQTGTGAGAVLATVRGAAWLREGGDAKDQWYALASATMRCDAVRGIVAGLTAKATSRGTVAQLAFVVDGWRCTADRDLRVGSCSVLQGGSARHVAVFPQNDMGMTSALSIYRGLLDLADVSPRAEPPVGSTEPAPAPAPDPAAYRGAPAQRCTAITGTRWQFAASAPAGWPRRATYPTGRSGDRWRVWALGGISCLAAQGWVADLAPRVVRDARGMGGLPTESQWTCVTGGGELLVGLCQRSTDPRGLFDHRGLVIAPDVGDAYLPFSTISYEEVWHEMLRFNAAAERPLTEPQLCLDRRLPAAQWTVDGVSGTRWAVGSVGGYLCGFLLASGLERLTTFAASTGSPRSITGGVGGQWRCTRNAGARLRCYYPAAGTMFRIVVQPYPSGRSRGAVEAEVLRALR